MTKETLLEYNKKYRIFGDHEAELLAAWDEICASEEKKAALSALCEKIDATPHADDFKLISKDDEPAIRYFALMEKIPLAEKRYASRGFSEEEITNNLKSLGSSLNVCYTNYGIIGYNPLYIWWAGLFITAEIFKFMGKELECKTYKTRIVWIRNRETGEIKPLYQSVSVHRSGHILGSAGCKDTAGSYKAMLFESDTAFLGHDVKKGLIDRVPTVFPKPLWETFLAPGDNVIGFHFPRNTSLKPEDLIAFYKSGTAAIKKHYPDFNAKCFFCSTWLLDPVMYDMLKPGSNIRFFQELMTFCPYKSEGTSVFGYVFPPNPKSYDELPEESSLQRNLKKLYMDGGYVYGGYGVLPFMD